jgi:hypothetical protein
MKYLLNLNDVKVLLDETQVTELVALLGSCEQLVDHHVGKNNGDHGYDMTYIYHVKPINIMESLSLRPMPDDQYGAAVLVTKLHKEGK